jgi:hypothetical protein
VQPVWHTSCIVLQFRTHDVLAVALTIPVVVCWTTMGARDQPGGLAVCRLGVAGHQVAGDGRPQRFERDGGMRSSPADGPSPAKACSNAPVDLAADAQAVMM